MFSFAEAAEGTSLQGRIAHGCLRGRMVADRDISTDDRQGPSHSVHTSDWGLNTVTDLGRSTTKLCLKWIVKGKCRPPRWRKENTYCFRVTDVVLSKMESRGIS